MIVGEFRNDHPRVTLRLSGDNGPQRDVEFIVDTGFLGELTLPPSLLRELGAQVTGSEPLRLADGVARVYRLYEVRTEWDDEERYVEAVAINGDPLLGIELLRGSHLHIEVTEGGEVLAEPL